MAEEGLRRAVRSLRGSGATYNRNTTPPIDAHLLEEKSQQISSRSDLKRKTEPYAFLNSVALTRSKKEQDE